MQADTSADAERKHAEALRRLGPQERFAMACRMSQTMREMAMSRIRQSHPDLNERGVLDQLIFELYGIRRNT
jgi:hypothetical protein